MDHKRRIEIIKLKYIKDLYFRINDGIFDLPPPPPELTGPNGQLLYVDEDFCKDLKKLDKRRKKLLKQKNKESPAAFVPCVTLEPSQIDPELDSLRIYDTYNESSNVQIKQEQEVEIIGENKRTGSVSQIRTSKITFRLQDHFNLIESSTSSTDPDPAGFSSRKSADEYLKIIEKDKRLIICLKPLPTNFPVVSVESPIYSSDGIFKPKDSAAESVTRSKSRSTRSRKRFTTVKSSSNRKTRSRLKLKDQHKVQERDLNEPNLISLVKSSDELLKEIEKEKRLIILLEPLSVYSPEKFKSPANSDVDEVFNFDNEVKPPLPLDKKKKKVWKKDRPKSTKKINGRIIHEKKLCPIQGCGGMISSTTLANHLRAHGRHGNNIFLRPENRPIKNVNESQICPYCGEQNLKDLEIHIENAHGGSKSIALKILHHKRPPKSVCCTICLEHFEDETSEQYFLHMKSHEEGWKISCGFCKDNNNSNFSFSVYRSYTIHIKTFHPYLCPILECSEFFMNIANFKEHMREKHLENCKEFGITGEYRRRPGEYMCSYCPNKFDAQYRLRNHLIMHEDPDSVTCTLCPTKKIFTSMSAFRAHKKNSHGEKTLPCTFEGCLKMFCSNRALREHLVYHDPNCTRLVSKRMKRSATLLNMKDPAKVYRCTAPGCDKEFANSTNSRSRHRNHKSVFHNTRVDSSSNQEIFNCPIEFCPAKSENKKVINLHVKLEHTEYAKDFVKNADKKFKCGYCDRSYNYQHALKDHEISHTDPAQTTCEVCKKFFSSKTMKNTHMKEDHGSKEIQCSFPNCNSMFSTEVYLKKHIKSIHKKHHLPLTYP